MNVFFSCLITSICRSQCTRTTTYPVKHWDSLFKPELNQSQTVPPIIQISVKIICSFGKMYLFTSLWCKWCRCTVGNCLLHFQAYRGSVAKLATLLLDQTIFLEADICTALSAKLCQPWSAKISSSSYQGIPIRLLFCLAELIHNKDSADAVRYLIRLLC